jgi:hypothetical protein
MSNSLAIAAVTATLRGLLIREIRDLPNQNVTTRPPDRAFGGGSAASDQLNVFLYQIIPNAAWRNRDIPNQTRPGETKQQPLALNLHYLISATGAGDDEIRSHRWLAQAMSIFHDYTILSPQEIREALTDNDLHEQVERVRISPLALSVEDLSKLWTTFTTPYRISTAYEVSVVLIESRRPARAPLPVLERNIAVQTNLLPPFPTLTQIDVPNPQSTVRCGDGSLNSGDAFTVKGHHLEPEAGEIPEVHFQHPRRREPLSVPVERFSATDISLRLPDNPDPNSLTPDPLEDPNQWLVGVYRVTVDIKQTRHLPDGSSICETRTTNELPLGISPRITNPNYVAETRRLSLTCTPRILSGQPTFLLIGDHQIASETRQNPTNTLDFTLPSTIPSGDYFVRIRVDGIDSLLITSQGTSSKLEFDPGQKVRVS